MILIVCGSRDWTDGHLIEQELSEWDSRNVTVYHGDCRGADRIAAHVAVMLGFDVKPFPADWRKWGKKAGPLRNSEMARAALARGEDVACYAFHDDIEASKGTKNMRDVCRLAGIPFTLWSHSDR